MKRWIFLILIFALGVAMFTSGKHCSAVKGMGDHFKCRQAKSRVEAILSGIMVNEMGGNAKGNETVAISRWWNDTSIVKDLDDLGKVSDAFDRWRMQAGIFPYIKSFTIKDARMVSEKEPVTVIVAVTIESLDYYMRVTEGETVEWASASDWPADMRRE